MNERFSKMAPETMPKVSVVQLACKTTTELRREQADFRRDRYENGRLRYLAHADGYVMVRRPHAVPYVIRESKWRQLPYLR